MVSDALLIFLPLRTLHVLKNQPSLRRRLQFTFAASALTTCASIATGVFNWLGVEFWYALVVELEVHIIFPTLLALLTVSFTHPSMQVWLSIIVCNLAVLAGALFKLIGRYSSTKPKGTIYSSRGRRVGVVPLPRVSPRTGLDGASDDVRFRVVELSKVDVTVDLELSDVSTMSMTRTKSPSLPPTTMFDREQTDLGV
jgi:hypothetical protein